MWSTWRRPGSSSTTSTRVAFCGMLGGIDAITPTPYHDAPLTRRWRPSGAARRVVTSPCRHVAASSLSHFGARGVVAPSGAGVAHDAERCALLDDKRLGLALLASVALQLLPYEQGVAELGLDLEEVTAV